jgi:hypothetical protein
MSCQHRVFLINTHYSIKSHKSVGDNIRVEVIAQNFHQSGESLGLKLGLYALQNEENMRIFS